MSAIAHLAVFAPIQAHRVTRCADALARLLEMGFRPWDDAEGRAARDYLLEEGGFHFLWEDSGWRVERCRSHAPLRQFPPAAVIPLHPVPDPAQRVRSGSASGGSAKSEGGTVG